MFLRRLGQGDLNQCESGHYCPQVLEMADGSFAVVGLNIKQEAAPHLPPGSGIGPDEGMVKVPRQVMIAMIPDLLKLV